MTKGGQSRDAECILSPVCSQRVQNLETCEISKNSTTKRKRRDLPSAFAWLWIAPDPVNQPAADGASSQFLRLLSSRPTAAPWLLLSVCVRWGGNPSSVVNIYTPDNSSHPTHQQATRRGETPGWREATCVCLPARAPQRAGGPGAWSRGKVTRRGRRLTRPMEKPINRWERPSLMDEPLTN